MANEKNLIPIRSTSEARDLGRKGGKASGAARRKKANFRKTLNTILTADLQDDEWGPVLESMGLDCTLEGAMLVAQIREALNGNTKAAYFVAQYAGQDTRSEADFKDLEADINLKKARKESITGENENTEALDRLDEILKGVRENAIKQEAE